MDFAAMLERVQAKSAGSYPGSKACETCRAFDHYQPCKLKANESCRLGWHFRESPGRNFGEVAFERCPYAARTHAQQVADSIRAREAEKAKALAAEAESKRRVIQNALQLAKGDQ